MAHHKQIHLLRHAQGLHNLRWENHIIPDPLLTELGLSQCREVAATFPPSILSSDSLLLAASPLRRTLYTALHSFPTLIAAGHTILAHPDAQETGPYAADTGSNPEPLGAEFDGKPVDLSLVHSGWNSKTGIYAPDAVAVEARAKRLRAWLSGRSEGTVLLVTHGAFLHYLTGDWEGFLPEKGTGWANCEWRSYDLVSGFEGDGDVKLVETTESRERRRGRETDMDVNEKMELKSTVELAAQAEFEA